MAVACLTAHDISIRFLSDRLPASVITPIFYVFAFFVLAFLAYSNKSKFEFSEIFVPGILISLAVAGITIALTDYLFVKTLNLGMEISSAIPILYGAVTVSTAILGVLIFKESLPLLKISGILLVITGIVFIHKG